MRANVDPALQEGLTAYASCQTGIRQGLTRQVNTGWQKARRAALSALESSPAVLLEAISTVVRMGESTAFGASPETFAAVTATTDDDSEEEDLSDDEGVQELYESEAVITFMELDVL